MLRAVAHRPAPPATIGGLGRRPLLTVGAIAMASTAAALLLPVAAAFVAAVGLLLLCFLPPLRLRRGILLAVAVFLLCGGVHRCFYELPLRAPEGQTVAVTARVIDLPRTGQMYTVEVTDGGVLPNGTRLALYCAPGSEPRLYDVVTATVRLESVPATSTYRRGNRIFLYAFPEGEWGASAATVGSSVPRLYALRQYFDRILRQTLPGEEGAILSALCLGQRDAVSETTDAAFRYSGLSHLLVVSGLHLSMVAVALRRLLRRVGVGYRLSAALTLPLIWAFAGMVGGTPSVLRAAVMCSLWLMGFVVFRRYDGLSAWGLAAALLLAADPYRLLHAGFQLSFAATAGVLIVAPRLCRSSERAAPPATAASRLWRGVRLYLRNGCGVCVSALLFTLPLTVFYYHGLSLTALPANLLAVVPAGWALTMGWLGLLCGSVPFLGWAAHPLLHAAGVVARWLQTVATLCGPRWAFASTPNLWQKWLIAALCGICIGGILCRIPWHRVLAAAAALAVMVCAVAVPLTVTAVRLTVIACGAHAAVLVQWDGRAALLADHSAVLGEVTYTLDERGVTRLEYLFIGDGSPANAAALFSLWTGYGNPAVYAAAGDRWYGGLDLPVTPCDTGQQWDLRSRCGLTRLADGWWRWDICDTVVLVGTDPAAPRPGAAALTVYTAMPKALPADGYCVVSCRRSGDVAPPMNGTTLLLTEETVTLTARRGGEWSVLPWL